MGSLVSGISGCSTVRKIPDALAALTEKLTSLTLLPSNRPSPPLNLAAGTPQHFRLEENELDVQGFSLSVTDDSCDFTLSSADSEHTINCGLNGWQSGTASGPFMPTTFWMPADSPITLPVASSGRWITQDTFELMIRFVASPDYYRFTATFSEDELSLKRQGFGMFGGPAEVVLTGTRINS